MVSVKFEALLQAEKAAQSYLAAAREDLVAEIREAKLAGVKKISDSPRCVVVRFSALSSNLNWSPEHYIQESQAEAVNMVLLKQTSASSFLAALDDMVHTGKAKVGKNATTLNEETLRILRETYSSLNIHH